MSLNPSIRIYDNNHFYIESIYIGMHMFLKIFSYNMSSDEDVYVHVHVYCYRASGNVGNTICVIPSY